MVPAVFKKGSTGNLFQDQLGAITDSQDIRTFPIVIGGAAEVDGTREASIHKCLDELWNGVVSKDGEATGRIVVLDGPGREKVDFVVVGRPRPIGHVDSVVGK